MNDADPRHGGYGHVCHEGCEVWKRTEPSQEAVEQLIAAIKTAKERFSDIRYDWTDPREDCRGGQEALDRALTLVDSALRALEQRTRLETLERAADVVGHWPQEFSERVHLAQAIRALEPREAPKAEEPKPSVCEATGLPYDKCPACPQPGREEGR